MDVNHFNPDGIDTSSSTNITDGDSTAIRSGTRPAGTETSGVLEDNGATVEVEKTSQPDQNLMATRPNGGWKAWLQVACGFFLYFNTYGAAAVASNQYSPLCVKGG